MAWLVLIFILINIQTCKEKKADNSPASRIQKTIKLHNSIKEINTAYPLIRKSSSSQEAVFGQDSIRVTSNSDSLKTISYD
jgi:hypothetical protein